MKKVLLLGATGSIGQSALSVIRAFPNKFRITALSANTSIDELARDAREFGVKQLHIADESACAAFQKKYHALKIRTCTNPEGLLQLIRESKADIVLNALVGSAGFQPTLAAIETGSDVALANKETLVMGGDIIMRSAKKKRVNIIPVDSEHSALFQILRHFKGVGVHKLILTASGGPFLHVPQKQFKSITVKQALKHPTWKMGSKITIDSATMMNKGLEVIEAHHLFAIPYEQIEVVVHPQSIIHSLVEFVDGEIYAQLGPTDMRYPIQNALTYPAIEPTPFHRLNLSSIREMNFYPPDLKKFKMLSLAYQYGARGGSFPAAFNAANEICVDAFLRGNISFTDIPRIVESAAESAGGYDASVRTVCAADSNARQLAAGMLR